MVSEEVLGSRPNSPHRTTVAHKTMYQSQKNGFRGFARVCAIYAHQYRMGLNPYMHPIRNPCIHHRILAPDERLQRMEIRRYATEVSTLTLEKRELEEAMNKAEQEAQKALTERDELISMYENKAEVAEECRMVAVSSLRKRWRAEKTQLEEDVRQLQNMVEQKEIEICKVKSVAQEYLEHMERLEERIVRLESDEPFSKVSRQVSMALSDISEVGLVRPEDGQTLEEKIRDLRDGVTDLVKEVRSRRKNAERSVERIFKLEEERLMWATTESAQGEIAVLKSMLGEAHAEIVALRRGRRGGFGGMNSRREGREGDRMRSFSSSV